MHKHATGIIGVTLVFLVGCSLAGEGDESVSQALSSDQPPSGWLDGISGSNAFGWSVDPDDSTSSQNAIHFYVDGYAGEGGTFAGWTYTNAPRPDVNSALGVSGTHGYSWTVPAAFRDGAPHTLYAYGISTGDPNVHSVLQGSPKTFQLVSTVTGALEGIDSNGIASGWAEDSATPSLSIPVHLYIDGPAGAGGTFIAVVPASIPRTVPASGPYGFRFPIPSKYRDGKPHALYAYGIASSGIGSDNLALSATPQTFVLDSTVVHLDNGVIRFGVEPRCGGTLVEMSVQGQNLVNNSDCTGRQVQAALYDGNAAYDSCAGCQGVWGWDPVQGGDVHNFGSPILAMSVTADSVYIKTQPNEWYPDNKGGGPGRPVSSDVIIEQMASFVPGSPHAVRLHYRITHFGTDTHASAVQEFPAVYANQEYNRFVSYGGPAPWTGGEVTANLLPLPGQAAPMRYVPERWAALVNEQDVGLTVYVPQQYPYVAGLQFPGTPGEFGSGANYFHPHFPFMFGPGSVLEGDVYVIAGDYQAARQDISVLRTSVAAPDILPPYGSVDGPLANQTVTGTIPVAGWAFDDVAVARVEVMVDGTLEGIATYGLSRPDVATVFPHAPENIGFSYSLDTSRYTNGPHQILIRAIDTAENVVGFPAVSTVVAN